MARYLKRAKALFQHVPRTGGTWVETTLKAMGIQVNGWRHQPNPICPKHALLSHYDRNQLARVEKVFMFVRHPLGLHESIWKFLAKYKPEYRQYRPSGIDERISVSRLRRIRTRWTWHPKLEAVKLWHPDFNEWAKRMLDAHPGWVTNLLELYAGPEGGEFVDFVGRNETLVQDFESIMIELGYASEWANVKPRMSAEIHNLGPAINVVWDSGLKRDVEQAEKRGIDRWYGKGANRIDYRRQS